MRRTVRLTVWWILLPIFTAAMTSSAIGAAAAETAAPKDLLEKVAERYKHLTEYEIHVDEQINIVRNGQSGGMEEKILLAVGKDGMFRVEQSTNGDVELRVSDGKIVWKALPKQKLWSKSESSQIVERESYADEASESMALDLFSQKQRSFVTRYTGLARYADIASVDKTEKLKFNGSKVECYVVTIPTRVSKNRLYVAKDSFFVVRHVEIQPTPAGQTEIKIDYGIAEGARSPDLFEFQPPNGSKEVADVSLPSERNMSLVGRQAADFTLKTVDGSPVRLADLRGKIVLLDFWATWCPPCRHELPTIEALSRKYKDRNVLVFGINDEEVKTAKHFLEQHYPDLATLHDGDGKVHRLYGCFSIPTVLVIDGTGKIVAHFVGERPENELVAALKQAGMN